MTRIALLLLLSAAGIAAAVFMVIQGRAPEPMSLPVAPAIEPIFPTFISGTGVVEAAGENIAIATPVSGVVATVAVACGQQVHAGQTLFTLEASSQQADCDERSAVLEAARTRLERLRSLPRREDLPPLAARLAEAEAEAEDASEHLRKLQAVGPDSCSRQDLDHARSLMHGAQARLDEARAQLASMHAGAWQADLAVAAAEVAVSQAQLHGAEVALAQRTIRAPVSGEVLQVAIHPGESASTQASQGLILLGAVDTMQVRVQIDENDAWRITPGLPAVAYLRGNHQLQLTLSSARIEPYVVPKRALSGLAGERIDTRVLEVIYRVHPSEVPIYVGQQLDVVVSAPGAPGAPPSAPGAPSAPSAPSAPTATPPLALDAGGRHALPAPAPSGPSL